MRDKSGFYHRDGKEYISVTKVLSYIDKPGLRYYYGKHGTVKAEEMSSEAKDIGTKVHDLVRQDMEGIEIAYTKIRKKQLKNAFQSYKLFKSEFELPKEEIVILDWKASDYVAKEHELQLAAYHSALQYSKTTEFASGWNPEVTLYNDKELYAGTADAIYIPPVESCNVKLLVVYLGKEEVKYKVVEVQEIDRRYKEFVNLKNFVLSWLGKV